jgi:hypothetical protein
MYLRDSLTATGIDYITLVVGFQDVSVGEQHRWQQLVEILQSPTVSF